MIADSLLFETDNERLAPVRAKLQSFLNQQKIPHLLFHGMSGTGKKTIVLEFLTKIFKKDKDAMKANVMMANCAHGKGIKFIREDLKLFAKTNIRGGKDIPFKIIVLMNADYLTVDAQSALRRCIELFSHTTRFFLIVEKKHRLLNPILSRFCPIFIPEKRDPTTDEVINMHRASCSMTSQWLQEKLATTTSNNEKSLGQLSQLANEIYQHGFCAADVVENIQLEGQELNIEKTREYLKQIQSEFRCEPFLILTILSFFTRIV